MSTIGHIRKKVQQVTDKNTQRSKKKSNLKGWKETTGKGKSKGNVDGLSRRLCSQNDNKFVGVRNKDNARKKEAHSV